MTLALMYAWMIMPMPRCLGGPGVAAISPFCLDMYDFERDGDVDLADWAWLQRHAGLLYFCRCHEDRVAQTSARAPVGAWRHLPFRPSDDPIVCQATLPLIAQCLTGPGVAAPRGCADRFDLDHDGDVDLADWGRRSCSNSR